jgi:hypothetical protein
MAERPCDYPLNPVRVTCKIQAIFCGNFYTVAFSIPRFQ